MRGESSAWFSCPVEDVGKEDSKHSPCHSSAEILCVKTLVSLQE